MRNKIFAFIWTIIGALAGFWMGAIPVELLFQLIHNFLGRHSPFVGLLGILLIIFAALGAQWFRYLFYKGILLGYKSDNKSEVN